MTKVYDLPWFICLILFTGIISGCGMFRNTVKTTDLSRQEAVAKTKFNIQEEQENLKKTMNVVVDKDSSGLVYQFMVWPKGRFSFTAEKGFEGEADSVKLIGNSWSLGNHLESVGVEEQQKIELLTTGEQLIKNKSIEENKNTKSSPSYTWIIGGLIALCLVLLLIFIKKMTYSK